MDLKERVIHLQQYIFDKDAGRCDEALAKRVFKEKSENLRLLLKDPENYRRLQVRRLKRQEGGERTVPMHSKLAAKVEELMPEMGTRYDDAPIWGDDYKQAKCAWGVRWDERFTDRYKFGSHDFRSYVVTKMQAANISPSHQFILTGHMTKELSKVVLGYTRATVEEARKVLELLE